MRITIFGSTKNEVHIGCHALSEGLENLIKKRFGKKAYIQHISVKYLSPIFYNTLLTSHNLSAISIVKKYLFKNFSLENKIHDKSLHGWLKATNTISQKENYIVSIIKSSDLVIINGEGTIHHNNLSGKQLLAIGYLAKTWEKPIIWGNFSTQNENIKILKIALDSDYIAVREPFSLEYLTSNNIKSTQSFDTAVLAKYNKKIKGSKKKMLIYWKFQKRYFLNKTSQNH